MARKCNKCGNEMIQLLTSWVCDCEEKNNGQVISCKGLQPQVTLQAPTAKGGFTYLHTTKEEVKYLAVAQEKISVGDICIFDPNTNLVRKATNKDV